MSITRDSFGIIDESCFSLRYPRTVDETFPTLREAVAEAMRLLCQGSATKVTVCRVCYQDTSPVETMASVTLLVNGDFDDLLDD
tara:strand:- start:2555 stop:2806 length:252 start_codon:yes stop_codon:yes gene_type:complete